MPEPAQPTVGPNAYLTLHYRLAIAGGVDIVNTFDGNPATFQIGSGQLAEPLEQCLLGLAEGEHRVFELEPGRAFGLHQPELMQRVSRSLLDEHADSESLAVGDVLELAAPDGGRFSARVCELGATGALLDFNHPLAGQRLQFEVRIIGIL